MGAPAREPPLTDPPGKPPSPWKPVGANGLRRSELGVEATRGGHGQARLRPCGRPQRGQVPMTIDNSVAAECRGGSTAELR